MGDVAMLVPVVRQLATEYPSLEIDVLSKRFMGSLFEGIAPNVHFIGSIDEVDIRRYRLVADMHSVIRSRLLSLQLGAGGAKVRHIRKGRLGKWLLVHGRRQQQMSTIERYMDVLRRLGLPINTPTPAIVTQERKNIGIAPFAAHTGKIYPLDRMESVVRMLGEEMSKRGEQVLLFGAGEKEKTILDRWATTYPGVVSMVGKMKMNEEVDCMSTLRLMLTMDSGNMHLASIAGTRVLSIWGATHPMAGFLGFGQQQKDCIQRELNCRPCSVYGNKPCRFGDYRCLDITPQEVVTTITNALKE